MMKTINQNQTLPCLDDHRLVVVGGIIVHANSGYVNPMPSRECRYCEIRNMRSKQIGGF